MSPVRRSSQELAELLDSGALAEETSREFAGLVALATTVREHVGLPTPAPAFRNALRSELLVAAPPLAPTVPVGIGARVREYVELQAPRLAQSGRAITASAAAAATVAAGGLVAASQHALPGELLYGLKGTTEDLRIGFSSGQAERGRLHLGFARERLEELERGVGHLSNDLLAGTLGSLDDEALAAADDLLAAFVTSADVTLVQDLTGFTSDAAGRLGVLSRVLPPEMTALAENSIELLRRIDVQVAIVTGVADECGRCAPARATVDDHFPNIARPGDGPAVIHRPCDCNGPVASPTQPPTKPTPPPTQPPSEPRTDPPTEPVEEPAPGLDLVPRLPEPLDPTGQVVEDTVNDLLDQLPIDPIELVPPPIREPVMEIHGQANTVVAAISQQIDDLLP